MPKNKLNLLPQGQKRESAIAVGQINLTEEQLAVEPSRSGLPILPTRNLVLFPGIALPITLGRESSETLVEKAIEGNFPIGIVCQKNAEDENPACGDLYDYGVVADVLKVFELPDGPKTVFVKARGKFKVLGEGDGSMLPFPHLSAKIRMSPEKAPDLNSDEFMLTVANISAKTVDILEKTGDAPSELVFNVKQISDPVTTINYISTILPVSPDPKMDLLRQNSLDKRALELLKLLSAHEQIIDLSHDIMERTRQNLDKSQRNAFLQQQMETIREELYGDNESEIEELNQKAVSCGMHKDVLKVFKKEVEKLRRYNPSSPDYSVQLSYLETLVSLPWDAKSELNHDFGEARNILEEDHFGLEKVKERVLEQLAVLMHSQRAKSPILCLVGPPGVGKTSLGKSIARSLGREFQRVSLGGLHDEAEIRGHRRTYIGAMPGRIIDAMKRAGTSNPVIMLDELDKIGHDYKGDPAAALLEVLDPEQNKFFHDNYIDVDFDLSKVLFIATANTLSTVQQPLIDRMEVIDLSGYLLEEKVAIARRHLLPKVMEEVHISDGRFQISDAAIEALIENYTSESGVRQLEKALASIARKYILALMTRSEDFPEIVEPSDLQKLLGVPRYDKEKYEGNEFPGVVTGLAWTSVGGEILLAETSLSRSKGAKLALTGNLGDVMKESATIALQWVKANAEPFGIDPEVFENTEVHIHFPEGAIPKDGPSAGITIVTSIVSAFTKRLLKPRIAMTGEITLRGKVLPVGGIKEKILAAKRAGITDIIMSKENRKNVEEIPSQYIAGLTFHYVDKISEVIDMALN